MTDKYSMQAMIGDPFNYGNLEPQSSRYLAGNTRQFLLGSGEIFNSRETDFLQHQPAQELTRLIKQDPADVDERLHINVKKHVSSPSIQSCDLAHLKSIAQTKDLSATVASNSVTLILKGIFKQRQSFTSLPIRTLAFLAMLKVVMHTLFNGKNIPPSKNH
ncbi:hypothetical protein CIHG_10130 [Coccidioides immitis H538.4]|uniref:Uncharacterized protein n=1 Tax=Coccidioides immitis H538.4 TaxID=396776 RepID=A0A0J8S5F6_COCIT|nr:hypothetical protein CIHG_10130 [Coccidioides immitis H538.4]